MKKTNKIKYKVVYNKKINYFQIQEQKKFLIFKWWHTTGRTEGAGGHSWVVTYKYSTQEKAIKEMLFLIKQNELAVIEYQKVQKEIQSKEEFKEITSDSIHKTHPEIFL